MKKDEFCSKCGADVIFKIHEGTGEKIPFLPGGEVPHKCPKPKTYFCPLCGDNGARIPVNNPCKHKRSKQPLHYSLDRFY